ncbi:retrovirus-related pol polyprotein from transposon TNT 1-94 [Tanacetum coccineum]
MQVNVQFLQQLQPEWSRFVTVVKQREEIDTVSYHRLFDVLKQFQNEVNDIAPKPQRSNAPSYMQSSSTRPSATTITQKGKRSPNIPPQLERSVQPTNNNLRTSSNSRNKTEDTTPRKPKQVKDYAYHKEKMMMCKQAEQGVPLQAEFCPNGEETVTLEKESRSKLDKDKICLGVDLEPDEWIKDSGCSKHMTGNRKLFSSCKAYNEGNAIFGSNLRGNIIGKGQICDNKCRVTFSEHDSEITKDGKVIATIDENSTLWHRRLGQANMHLIQSLASKELVRNLPKLKFDQHFCDACKIGKQAHVSRKAKNIVSTTRCLELLHMDLFGPSAVRSYRGNRYTLVIVDDYSRYT